MCPQRLLLVEQHIAGRPEPTTWGSAILLGTTFTELGKWADPNDDHCGADQLPPRLIQ